MSYVRCCYVLEAEARQQNTEAANAASVAAKSSTDNKEDHMTSSQHTFLPYDVTTGESVFLLLAASVTFLAIKTSIARSHMANSKLKVA